MVKALEHGFPVNTQWDDIVRTYQFSEDPTVRAIVGFALGEIDEIQNEYVELKTVCEEHPSYEPHDEIVDTLGRSSETVEAFNKFEKILETKGISLDFADIDNFETYFDEWFDEHKFATDQYDEIRSIAAKHLPYFTENSDPEQLDHEFNRMAELHADEIHKLKTAKEEKPMADENIKALNRVTNTLIRVAEALEVIGANMGDGTTAPAEDPKPEPKKATKPKADPKPKSEPKEEPKVEEKAEEITEDDAPAEMSAQDLRAKLIEVMQKVDKPSAVAIVDKFAGKGGKMGDIPDDKRGEAFAEAEELLSL